MLKTLDIELILTKKDNGNYTNGAATIFKVLEWTDGVGIDTGQWSWCWHNEFAEFSSNSYEDAGDDLSDYLEGKYNNEVSIEYN